MKKVLFFLFCLASLSAYGQDTKTPFATTAIPIANRYAYTNNGLWVDSAVKFIYYRATSDTTLIGIDATGKAYKVTKSLVQTWAQAGVVLTLQQVATNGDTTNHLITSSTGFKAIAKDSAYIVNPFISMIPGGFVNAGLHSISTVTDIDTFVFLTNNPAVRDTIMTTSVLRDTAYNISQRVATKVNYTDTAAMLDPYLLQSDTASLSHRIDILGGNEIVFSTIKDFSDTNTRNDESSIVRLQDGRLFMAFTAYSDSATDFAQTNINKFISNDNGVTWTDFGRMITSRDTFIVTQPSLYKKADGSLICLFIGRNTVNTSRIYQVNSTNNGSSWSSPIVVFDSSNYVGNTSNRIFKTKTGRLLFPIDYSLNGAQTSLDVLSRGKTIYSDNEGTTWQTGAISFSSSDSAVMESGHYQIDDSIFVYWRTRSGVIFGRKSVDDGITWGTQFTYPISSPIAQTGMYYFPERSLLIAVHNRYIGLMNQGVSRKYLDVEASSDGGLSFSRVFTFPIDDSFYMHQPCIFDNGRGLIIQVSRIRTTETRASINQIILPYSFLYPKNADFINNAGFNIPFVGLYPAIISNSELTAKRTYNVPNSNGTFLVTTTTPGTNQIPYYTSTSATSSNWALSFNAATRRMSIGGGSTGTLDIQSLASGNAKIGVFRIGADATNFLTLMNGTNSSVLIPQIAGYMSRANESMVIVGGISPAQDVGSAAVLVLQAKTVTDTNTFAGSALTARSILDIQNGGTLQWRIGATGRINHLGETGVASTTNGIYALTTAVSTVGLRLGIADGTNMWIQSNNNLPLVLNETGNNVGIGFATTPQAKLHIANALSPSTTNYGVNVRLNRYTNLAESYGDLTGAILNNAKANETLTETGRVDYMGGSDGVNAIDLFYQKGIRFFSAANGVSRTAGDKFYDGTIETELRMQIGPTQVEIRNATFRFPLHTSDPTTNTGATIYRSDLTFNNFKGYNGVWGSFLLSDANGNFGIGVAPNASYGLDVNSGVRATTLTASGLTAGRIPYTGTGGLLQSTALLTYDATGSTLGVVAPAASGASTSWVLDNNSSGYVGISMRGSSNANNWGAVNKAEILTNRDLYISTGGNSIFIGTGSGTNQKFSLSSTGNFTAQDLIQGARLAAARTITFSTGTNAATDLDLVSTINTSGGTNTIRGTYYHPTVTSSTGSTIIANENTVGNNYSNTTSGNSAFGVASGTTLTEKVTVAGNVNLNTAGNKLLIATGTNASVGVTASMSLGVVTITSTAITASSIVMYSRKTTGGTTGQVSITAQSSGSVTLTSNSAIETSTFNYWIIN